MAAETVFPSPTSRVTSSGPVSRTGSRAPAPVQSSAAPAAPSNAIIIYRQDEVHQGRDGERSSSAMEYNIVPGQSVDTCHQQPPDYFQFLASDDSSTITVGPFDSYDLTGCVYAGTDHIIGNLTCGNFVRQASVPQAKEAQVAKCGVATDTTLVYVEW